MSVNSQVSFQKQCNHGTILFMPVHVTMVLLNLSPVHTKQQTDQTSFLRGQSLITISYSDSPKLLPVRLHSFKPSRLAPKLDSCVNRYRQTFIIQSSLIVLNSVLHLMAVVMRKQCKTGVCYGTSSFGIKIQTPKRIKMF